MSQIQNIQLQMRRVKIDQVYFKNQISREFRRLPMPENIRKHRNIAIILIAV